MTDSLVPALLEMVVRSSHGTKGSTARRPSAKARHARTLSLVHIVASMHM